MLNLIACVEAEFHEVLMALIHTYLQNFSVSYVAKFSVLQQINVLYFVASQQSAQQLFS